MDWTQASTKFRFWLTGFTTWSAHSFFQPEDVSPAEESVLRAVLQSIYVQGGG